MGRRQLSESQAIIYGSLIAGISTLIGVLLTIFVPRLLDRITNYQISQTMTPSMPRTGINAQVYSNAEWQPYIIEYEREFDGVEMVLVPKGCFMMGSSEEQIHYILTLPDASEYDDFSNEQPIAEICFQVPFWIDSYEVNNQQFTQMGGQAEFQSNWLDVDHPRDSISWFEARYFCEQKRAGRLPTEAEWEYAARGPDALIYPWGNTFLADNLVYRDNSNDRTAPVGSKPGGKSWVGAYDMSGNVEEWVSTVYWRYPYKEDDGREVANNSIYAHVLRGGLWWFQERWVRSAYRNWNTNISEGSTLSRSGIGFRCARNWEPEE